MKRKLVASHRLLKETVRPKLVSATGTRVLHEEVGRILVDPDFIMGTYRNILLDCETIHLRISTFAACHVHQLTVVPKLRFLSTIMYFHETNVFNDFMWEKYCEKSTSVISMTCYG